MDGKTEGFGVTKGKRNNGANLGFEQKLWQAADKLRSNMDAAEYKHVVLGLIFLKYISDAFEDRRGMIEREASTPGSEWYVKEPQERYEVMEDRDEYVAANIFWVPKEARWDFLQKNAKQPTIGKLVDNAMDTIEKDNPSLKGVLPKDYARPSLDKARLGELIDLIGTIGLGDRENRSKDILGRVYEYFLGQFADAEGKKGGQFYTPRSIVKLLAEMIEPYKGRVFDPCCGSGGMFVQSEKFAQAHGGRIGDISVYGQESNPTTWRLCKMNLAIRGIDADIQWGDSFHNDQHKDLKANFILANPPFNDSDWKGELLKDDARWKYGTPPVGNANFAWVQQFIHHLAPNGITGFVLANGSMSSNTSGEGDIRKNIVEADLVDCMIALPTQLFYNTMIPACLWFVIRDKKNSKFRDRRGEILFIDARKMGVLIDRRHRGLTDEEIQKIASTYHAWRGERGKYEDIKGFCMSATIEEIRKHGHILTPGRYVGAGDIEEDDEVFEEKMKNLTSELSRQLKESREIEIRIKNNLKSIGYEL
jgi:type I restriction enzyme M protein